jgi:molybdopterin molybdotransferase
MAQQIEEAFAHLIAHAQALPAERVSVRAALGRVAAANVTAARQLPGFKRAAMDGYVCHDADLSEVSPEQPVRLRISGEVRMGEGPQDGPNRGETWSITTGGAIPSRGDRVVPLEDTRRQDGVLVIHRPLDAKKHVAEADEELPLGAVIVRMGDLIGPSAVGTMAGAAIPDVLTYRRPRVALISTGDELIDAQDIAPSAPAGRIVNTNAWVLKGEMESAGCLVEYRGIVRDDRQQLSAAFQEAADSAFDVVVSTGGVSVGPYDRVPRAWLDLGAKRIVGRVDLKPGGPFFAGILGSTWAIGLSGSPAALLAAYHLLLRPLLYRLAGHHSYVRPITPVRLATGHERRADRFRVLWTRVEDSGKGWLDGHVLTDTTLGILGGMARANGLLLLRPGTPPLPAGSHAPALLLDRPEDRQEFHVPPSHLAPMIVGVVGSSGEGKTTVIAGLLRRLREAGVRGIAVKHASHGFAFDQVGTDSARMFEAGAGVVLVAGPNEVAVRLRLDDRPLEREEAIEIAIAAAQHLDRGPPQVVLVEGFRHPGRLVLRVGTAKPEAQHDPVWMDLPSVSSVAPQEMERALDRLTALLVEKIGVP